MKRKLNPARLIVYSTLAALLGFALYCAVSYLALVGSGAVRFGEPPSNASIIVGLGLMVTILTVAIIPAYMLVNLIIWIIEHWGDK